MSNINVWTYQEKYQDKTYWRADIVTKEGEINGLILKIDDVGKCIDVCRPEMETLEDTKQWLEVIENCDALRQAVFNRFKVYAKKEIRMANEDNKVRVKVPYKIWVVFHRGNQLPPFDKSIFRANVRINEKREICGIRIEWIDNETVNIRIPSKESFQYTRYAALDQRTWTEIVERIIDWYNNVQVKGTENKKKPSEPERLVHKSEEKAHDKTDIKDESLEFNQSRDANIIRAPMGTDSANIEKNTTRGESDDNKDNAYDLVSDKTEYGRVKNSKDSGMFKYIPGNVLRPCEMIEQLITTGSYKYSPKSSQLVAQALGNGTINNFHVELLSLITVFRFLTTPMLLDLYGAGYLSKGQISESSMAPKKMNKAIEYMEKIGLVTPCRFISVDSSGNFDYQRKSVARIIVLSQLGSTLLNELGRESYSNSFEAYQDGNAVRERLSLNQWVVYWMATYPEIVLNKYGFSRNAYSFSVEMVGIKMAAWIMLKDQLLIAQSVRRGEEDNQGRLLSIRNKVNRYVQVFREYDKVYSFDGDEYIPMKLQKRPIIQYICEDEDHMREVAQALSDCKFDGLDVWMTYDQRLFNYEFEGRRFLDFSSPRGLDWIDHGIILGIGEERKEEKTRDRPQ